MWWPGTPGLPRHWGGERVLPGASLAHARVREAKRCHGEASAASRTTIPPWHLLASGAATLTHEQELDTWGCSVFAQMMVKHFSKKKKKLTATKGQIAKKGPHVLAWEYFTWSLRTWLETTPPMSQLLLQNACFLLPAVSLNSQWCQDVGTQTWTVVTSLAAQLPLTPSPSPLPPYTEVR